MQGRLINIRLRREDVTYDSASGGAPVSDHGSVHQDDRPEDTVAAVGAVGHVRLENKMAALIANQVLVIRGEESHRAVAEASGSAVLVPVES